MMKIIFVRPVASLEITSSLIGIVETLCARGHGIDCNFSDLLGCAYVPNLL